MPVARARQQSSHTETLSHQRRQTSMVAPHMAAHLLESIERKQLRSEVSNRMLSVSMICMEMSGSGAWTCITKTMWERQQTARRGWKAQALVCCAAAHGSASAAACA